MVARVIRLALLIIFVFMTPFALADYNSYPKITQMEKKLYHQSYESQDIYQRLARIETSLYRSVLSNKSLSERVDLISNQLHISSMPSHLLSEIDHLEKMSFKKNYRGDSPDKRLERLEYHLAGALQDGNYTDRVYKLKRLSNRGSVDNYFNQQDSLYNNPEPAYYTGAEDMNGWQKTLMFLAPILMGIL